MTSFKGLAVVALLQDVIRPADRRQVSTQFERRWILSFWELFKDLPDPPTMDDLKLFPLIPTVDELTFISLDKATSLPVFGKPPSESSDAHLLGPLQKLGAEFIGDTRFGESPLPSLVRVRLSDVAFDFKRVMEFFKFISSRGSFERQFKALSSNEWESLATWVREKLEAVANRHANNKTVLDIAPRLPVWPTFRGSGPAQAQLRSLTDPLVLILPRGITSIESIALFLGKYPNYFYVQHRPEMQSLSNATPMPVTDFLGHLNFPLQLRSLDMLKRYKCLLDGILGLAIPNGHPTGLMVPDPELNMVNITDVYKSTVPEFQAAFTYRQHNFVHPQLRPYEDRLVKLGLRGTLSSDTFIACVAAIHEDFAGRDSADDLERCMVVYRCYSTQLPLVVSNDSTWWRHLDAYAFIPIHPDRRIGGGTSFQPAQFASNLRHLVNPKQILRHDLCSVAWTQRALFVGGPDRRLLMADESIGIPSVGEVVRFWVSKHPDQRLTVLNAGRASPRSDSENRSVLSKGSRAPARHHGDLSVSERAAHFGKIPPSPLQARSDLPQRPRPELEQLAVLCGEQHHVQHAGRGRETRGARLPPAIPESAPCRWRRGDQDPYRPRPRLIACRG